MFYEYVVVAIAAMLAGVGTGLVGLLWSSIFVTLMAKKSVSMSKIEPVPDRRCGIHYSCADGYGYM